MLLYQNFPPDMPAARRDQELRQRKEELKARQAESAQEFGRKQRVFLDMEMRKTQRRRLLQLEQLEQRENQEVRSARVDHCTPCGRVKIDVRTAPVISFFS